MPTFSEISLLVTHYNRGESLARLLGALRARGVAFAATVVSDDGSRPEHLERLRALQGQFGFDLVTTPVNQGLGHNLNKGQDRIRTPYTLYVQEDFVPLDAFPHRLSQALAILEARREIDLIRLYNHDRTYPHLVPFRDGFSEMAFRVLRPGVAKFFVYSDTPHLRRAAFAERFGRYTEGVRSIKCEKAMVMSFLQARGRCLICETNDSFAHENTAVEPSTQDYSAFFRIKRLFPAVVFEWIWTLKLTLQYWFVDYRSRPRTP